MKAQLSCGVTIEAEILEGTQIIEVAVIPAEGTKIEETAFFKDGKLRINMTMDSLVDLYKIIHVIVSVRKPKSLWETLFRGGY